MQHSDFTVRIDPEQFRTAAKVKSEVEDLYPDLEQTWVGLAYITHDGQTEAVGAKDTISNLGAKELLVWTNAKFFEVYMDGEPDDVQSVSLPSTGGSFEILTERINALYDDVERVGIKKLFYETEEGLRYPANDYDKMFEHAICIAVQANSK